MSFYVDKKGQLAVGAPRGAIVGGGAPGRAPAPPAERVVVGGAAYETGGWGQHECERRQERYLAAAARAAKTGGSEGGSEGGAPSYGAAVYGGRRWVAAADAAESIAAAAWKRRPALRVALGRLAAALGRLEDELCAPDESGAWECLEAGDGAAALTVPPLTSADVRAAAADPLLPASPELLSELDAAVRAAGAAYGLALAPGPAAPVPAPDPEPVDVGDDAAVFELEARALPRVRALEQVQAGLAARADAVARAIAARSRGPRK